MSDALLSPNYLQNSDVFQELISSQIGDNNSPLGMQEIQHPNVAVYLRVSTGDQTVEAQKLRLTSLLAVEGYDINQCMLYIDDGVSAKRKPAFTDRPEGSRMMQDVANGKITKIFGTYVNRFFRRVSQGAMWLDEMKDTYPNVIIKTSDCFADSNSSAGRMMWHTLLMVSEMENEQRAERTQSGMQRIQERLGKSSHAVFGWFWNEEDGRMNPHWHQQSVIRYVKSAWNDDKGQSFAAIARELNRCGVPTSTGKAWSNSGVSRLVKKPSKMQDQLHQFTEPKRMISHPFRGYNF